MNKKKYNLLCKMTALTMSVMLMFAVTACGDNVPDRPGVTTTPTAEATPGTDPATTPDASPTGAEQGLGSGTTELTGSSGAAPATKTMDETMRAAYASFAYDLFNSCAKGSGKNCLVSPFSVYTALAMLANGADGSTAAQFNSVMGLNEEQRNAYMAAWIAELTGQSDVTFSCADSVWVSNRFRDIVRKEFLAACADSYRAEVFAAEMNNGTVDDINNWTYKNTDGMIQKILEYGDIDPAVIAILANAITMDAKWAEPFADDNIRKDGVFTHADGKQETAEMMAGEADRCYLENDVFTGFTKSYKGGNFKYVALLPKEGVSMEDALAALNAETVDSLFAKRVNAKVNIYMPKYKTEYKKELKNQLIALGLSDMFDPGCADLSRMVTTGINYVDRVLHKTYLSLDNEGTRAAAVTLIVTKNYEGTIEESYYVALDRPFIYMIVDSNNLPLFIGTYQ